ncbi:MAG: zinc ribbon domain-containing protein [Ruminococcaceae bacterium]|nr:zinc ribbon domain-containing protein [Oscillospiraceae bacterium]
MFCTNCGTRLIDGAKFCGNCGEKAMVLPSPEITAVKEELIEEEKAFDEAASDAAVLVTSLDVCEDEKAEADAAEEIAAEEGEKGEELVTEDNADDVAVEETAKDAFEDEAVSKDATADTSVIDEAAAAETEIESDATREFVPEKKYVSEDYTRYEAPKPQTVRIDPRYKPLGTGSFIGMWFLMLIPVVNLILLLVWAFSSRTNFNRKSYARAILIMSVISIVLTAVLVILGIQFGLYLVETYVYPFIPELEEFITYITEF